MKKLILASALMVISQLSYGQGYVQAANNTGFTYDCDEYAGLTGASWSQYFPDCIFTANYQNGGGGFDNAPVNELKLAWGQADPGFNYNILTLATPLDLSAAANQRIKITLRSLNGTTGTPIPYTLVLENTGNTSTLLNTINIPLTNSNQNFDIDLSTYLIGGQNLSDIKKIIIFYDRCPATTVVADDIFVSNFVVGSSIPTAITDANGSVSSANVFPNPTSGLTTINAELKASSDVKVSLMDIYGKEVKTIVEGNYSSINTTFDVSTIASGVYFVKYVINGATAKVERLVVR